MLPTISKILEKVAIRQIMKYTKEEQKILPKLQFGFRKHYSICSVLTNMFADLFEARDKDMCSAVVLLDYSQAFGFQDSLGKIILTS